MENQPNNFNNLNEGSVNVPVTETNEQNTPSQAAELNTTPEQQVNQPVQNQPAYPNPNEAQYTPNIYTAPYYTAPAVPYNQTITSNMQQMSQSPSSIYNNCCNGTTPQYHYGAPLNTINLNNAYYLEQQQKLLMKKQAEKKIRGISNISGAALIACLIVAFLFSFILLVPSVSKFYDTLTGSSFINMIYSLIVVGGTFLVFKGFFKQHSKEQSLQTGGIDPYEFKTSLSAPKNSFQAALLVFISFGGCMFANYFSTIIISFLSTLGLHSTYNSIENPQTATEILLMFIATAIIPSLVEEYAIRGVLLSNLRRYGNGFAIIASAVMFGIFHGDASQIPFAFICGLFFGYAVIATGSIWTGIIVHIMNNSLSCISSVLLQVADEEVANTFFYTVSIGGIILAICCVFIYYFLFKDDGVLVFKGDANELTTAQKLKKFFTSPVMIVAIVLYFAQALTTLTTKS